jgi:putative Holliday junction resolvase
MSRILCIDYGKKRTGIAVTDPMQIIATGLTTVDTQQLFVFLKDYISREPVERILVGMPLNLDGTDTDATPAVKHLLRRLANEFPSMPVETVDERYSSKMATRAMVDMGMKKKDRRNKALVDEIAATLMLQEYMQSR